MPEVQAVPDAAPLIALVTRSPAEEHAAWLARLRGALPGEAVRSFAELGPEERARVDIAVVANPDPADLRLLPGLRWIHSLWAGVERLMRELPADAPPVVRLVDPELSRVMAEAVLAWTYYLVRDMPDYAAQQRAGVWKPRRYRKPSEQRIGLLGLGALGQEAARWLLQAGFRVSGWSRSLRQVPGVQTHAGEDGLRAMLGEADVVVCLLPLTDATAGLLDARRLGWLKPGAELINFGRGPVIDTAALLAALDSGAIGHAVLDVFEAEPLPPGDRRWAHKAVTVLPHISAPTDPLSATGIVAANIADYRRTGAMPRTVDRLLGY